MTEVPDYPINSIISVPAYHNGLLLIHGRINSLSDLISYTIIY